MTDPKLSKEEKEILKAFEAGEFKSVLTPRRKKMLQASAEATVNSVGQIRPAP